MRRFKVAVFGVACVGTLGLLAGPASASTPVVQACVGSTFSTLAHGPGPLGQGVKSFAQDPNGKPGLGDGIQALQAGAVTQDVVPNTCNVPG